ncbi:unnamed protein product [Amaranthus hypochondriacus]
MEFWGAEIKNGGSLKVQPGEGKVLHLSQACLGEIKKDKGNEFVRVFVQINGQKFVIGMLSLERLPHLNLDLVFEDEFELSHDLKQGSVHFAGYKADDPVSAVDEDETDDDEELVPIDSLNSGKPEDKDVKPSSSMANSVVRPEKAESKSKVKIVEPGKDAKKNLEDDESDDDDEDDNEDDDDDDDDEDGEGMEIHDAGSEDEDEDEDEDDEEEDSGEETPIKVQVKKRPVGSTSKTPVPEKKAKFSTPQGKAEGKKVSGHVATPHPAKHAGKIPANADKTNKQTPSKAFTCSSCNKSFGSEQAVQSHSKAKHGG